MMSAAYFSTCLVRSLCDFLKFHLDIIREKNSNDIKRVL